MYFLKYIWRLLVSVLLNFFIPQSYLELALANCLFLSELWTAALQRHRKAAWLRGHSWINIYVRGPWTWVYNILGMILLGKGKTRIAFTMCLKHHVRPCTRWSTVHVYFYGQKAALSFRHRKLEGKKSIFCPWESWRCVHRGVVSIRRCRAIWASTCVPTAEVNRHFSQ